MRCQSAAEALAADMILVGTNVKRYICNRRHRELKKIESPTPLSGERLVCLKNDRAKHLFNGGTWTVEKVRKSNGTAVRMVVAPEDAGDARRSTEIKVHPYALRQLGFAKCERVDFDHDPALGLRPWDDEKQDFIPPQLDPDFIVIRTEPAHDKKTNGNGATSYGSDKHAIAKVDRVGEVEEAFRRRLLAKSDPDIDAPRRPRSRIPSRGFSRQQRPLRSRNSFHKREE